MISEKFVIGHEEGVVAAVEEFGNEDGATDFEAELILVERSLGGGGGKKEGTRVHVTVAEELEQCAVEGVGAALR